MRTLAWAGRMYLLDDLRPLRCGRALGRYVSNGFEAILGHARIFWQPCMRWGAERGFLSQRRRVFDRRAFAAPDVLLSVV